MRSKQHLSDLAYRRKAKADCYKTDRYGREVCAVFVDGKDVGLEQIMAGMAWWFRKYASEQLPRNRIDYESAEEKAAADRTGLWQDANPVPPWEWRARSRNGPSFEDSSGTRVQRLAPDMAKPLPRDWQRDEGCGSRGGPGWRKPSGQCASWKEVR